MAACAEETRTSFVSTFPLFVPSLSWQMFGCQFKVASSPKESVLFCNAHLRIHPVVYHVAQQVDVPLGLHEAAHVGH